MKKILFVMFVWGSLITSIHAFVGAIERHSGQAFVVRNTQTIKVYNGLKLKKKDIIKTKRNAWVKLKLHDNTIINAGQNAQLVIEEYLYTKKSNSKASFSFIKGLFRTITGKIGKVAPSQFKVRTPNATIGIRGTEFYVDISKGREKIACTRGSIIVNSLLGEVEVEAGRQLLMNGKQNKIQQINLNRIKKAVGVALSRATPRERALIKRNTLHDSSQARRSTTREGGMVDGVIEQGNTVLLDSPVPEVPPHTPCPVPR